MSRPYRWLSTLLAVICSCATALPATTSGVDDLPLLELPVVSNASDTFAILLSGDGGWSALDKAVARELNAHGIPVVGWDALRYFWHARTPAGAASDLDRVMRHYARTWRKSRVLLLGYSQGADTLPFMINRLPADSARRVRATVLVNMGAEALFEFHLSHWIGTPEGGLPTRPEVTSGRLGPVFCVYGRSDDDSACQGLQGTGVHAVALAGGHHFDGDYATLATAIVSALAL